VSDDGGLQFHQQYQQGERDMKIHAKLMKARLALQGKKLEKSGHNKFAGYKYFELGDFLPTVQEIFYDLGLCGVVSYTAETSKLVITDVDTGDAIEITSPMGSAALKGCHEVQNIGAVETYQRRYLWVTAMEIVEHDVLDATVGQEKAEKAITPTAGVWESMSTDEQTFLMDLAAEVKTKIAANDVPGAVKHLESANLGTDQKIAIWTRFDSKERTAMKKEQTKLKEAA